MITESMQCGYELDAKSHAGEVTSPCISIRNMEDKISGYGKKFFYIAISGLSANYIKLYKFYALCFSSVSLKTLFLYVYFESICKNDP